MSKLWISGDTNIKTMQLGQKDLIIELIQEYSSFKQDDGNYCIDLVKIPKAYINAETYHAILEQFLTNDLKHVGYEYIEQKQEQNKAFKTMYKTQVRGTLNLLLHELAS